MSESITIKQDESYDAIALAIRRKRCREKQARYRMKQRKLTESLERAHQTLQEEVEQLELRRNNLFFGTTTTTETVFSVVAEYFRVFRRGLIAPDGIPILGLGFLRATMTPDMDAGTVCGFEALARNWKVFTQNFADVTIQLERLDQVAERSLIATTTTSVTITSITLRNLFPHLTWGRVGRDVGSHLAHRLLGQQLVMRGSVRFDWDDTNNRVVGLISQADMVSPLLQLLSHLDDVSMIFSDALIQPDANLVVGDYLAQHQLCC